MGLRVHLLFAFGLIGALLFGDLICGAWFEKQLGMFLESSCFSILKGSLQAHSKEHRSLSSIFLEILERNSKTNNSMFSILQNLDSSIA